MKSTAEAVCKRCVMDTTDPDIIFDADGVCNHCRQYESAERNGLPSEERRGRELQTLVHKIKASGKFGEYDCILGVSGGVDSSFVAYNAIKLGLRPLAVHLDNGWDSELSVKNIESILRTLGVELFTYVLDWEEFSDLQKAFFKASVVDIEMLTDHAITAILYRIARQKKIKYILSGSNIVTEAVMPRTWKHRKSDLRNIRAIHNRFGTRHIRSFPTASTLRLEIYRRIEGITPISFLNYFDYVKEDAMAILQKELGWKYYGGKHYESVFTRFYQAHILPCKFGIDKRKAHYSTLICSRQITREAALAELQKPLYDSDLLQQDRRYVTKKLGMSEESLADYLDSPGKSHYEYPTDQWVVNLMDAARSVRQTFHNR